MDIVVVQLEYRLWDESFNKILKNDDALTSIVVDIEIIKLLYFFSIFTGD